jgi:hypothetical protein
MHTLALLLVCAAPPPPQSTLPAHVPCEVTQPADVAPPTTTALPRGAGTGIPPLDNLLREAKRRNSVVAQKFNEDGRGVQWFQATPDGWLTRIKDPSVPRPEVVAGTAFRPARNVPGLYECEYDPDHVCNRCGHVQLVIARWNRDGTHTHVCANCRHAWRH